MKTELTIVRYNVMALLGWLGIITGLIAAFLQYLSPTAQGIFFLAIGLVGGAVTVTFAGPLKTITTKSVTLREVTDAHRKD